MSINQVDVVVGGRVENLIQELGTAKGAFAESVNMDKSNLSKVLKGERGLTIESALVISTKYQVSLNWLLAGYGEMWIQDKDKGSDETSRHERDEDVIIKLKRTELEALQTSFEILSKACSRLLDSDKEGYDPSVEVMSLGKMEGSFSQKTTLKGT